MASPASETLPPVVDVQAPRLYQSELFEECKARKNIIIRGDTGTGKTLVALLLIRWLASQPRPLDPSGRPKHSIQAFLVPTRALVEQQLDELQKGTNLRFKGLTGQDEPELWKQAKWHDELMNLDVLVCTHTIFLDLLSKGFWSLDRVSLIVFDEAHHCRKKHPYAQIMKDHYHRLRSEGLTELPRILGLTASPLFNVTTLEQAKLRIDELQQALFAKIYEVRLNREDVERHTFRPSEKILYFEPPLRVNRTVSQEWHALDFVDQVEEPGKYTSTLERLAYNLGPFAQLLYAHWHLKRILATCDFLPPQREPLESQLKAWKTRIDDPHGPRAEDLIPKLIDLIDCLASYRHSADSRPFLGMVFVERRIDAELIKQILEKHEKLRDWVKPIALVGHGGKQDEKGMDTKSQNRAVEAFRKRVFNVAVATNVAEEGLDFPACRLVVRFDEIKTYKGYLQARGRARAENSDYVIFLDRTVDNREKYFKWRDTENQLREQVYDQADDESACSDESAEAPRHIIQLDDGNESVLTHAASPGLLSDACQLLPHDPFTPIPRPIYNLASTSEGYVSTVTLPTMAELPPDGRDFQGSAMPTKKSAKRSAAFEACKKLLEVDVLTKHLLPMREDLVAEPTDADGYPLMEEPIAENVVGITSNPFGNIWQGGGFLHRLVLDPFDGDTFELGFICGEELPSSDGLVMYDHDRNNAQIAVSIVESIPLDWSDLERHDRVRRLGEFTRLGIQVCVNRRGYDSELLFFLAPLVKDTPNIDWDLVDKPLQEIHEVDAALNLPFVVAPLRSLHNRLLRPKEACNNIILKAPVAELPEVEGMERFRRSIVRSKLTSIDHYYNVAIGLPLEVTTTPLVFLDSMSRVRNNLRPAGEGDKAPLAPMRCVLPIGACHQSRLSFSMWHAFTMLPSLSRLLHDAAQVDELMESSLVESYDTSLVIEALTPPGVNIGYDYQTLETVGDAFLKLAVSVYLYISRPDRGEGTLSVLRSRSIDNAYLRGKAVHTADIADWVLGQHFRTDQFCAAHIENARQLIDGRLRRKVARRVLSDVIEATLGAVYVSGGVESALALGTSYGLCFGSAEPWSERKMDRGDGSITSGPAHVPLQQQLGYTFKDPRLLVQAVNHRSANSFYTGCYEREEWIGDAILDMWIIEHLYRRFPTITAEQLTFVRASIVNNGSLGFLALRKLSLHKIITHNASTLEEAYKRAQKEIECFDTIASFYEDHTNAFTAYDPPKILGDALEAIIGAIFVDSGFDLKRTYAVIDKVFEEVLPVIKQGAPRDPLSRMLHTRDRHFCIHLHRTMSVELEPTAIEGSVARIHSCEVIFHDTVLARGRHATSASVAEQRAAKAAMDALADEERWSICLCAEAKRIRDEEIKAERKKVEKAVKEAAMAPRLAAETKKAPETEAREDTPFTISSTEPEGDSNSPTPLRSDAMDHNGADDDDARTVIAGERDNVHTLTAPENGSWRGVKRERSNDDLAPSPNSYHIDTLNDAGDTSTV